MQCVSGISIISDVGWRQSRQRGDARGSNGSRPAVQPCSSIGRYNTAAVVVGVFIITHTYKQTLLYDCMF